MNIKLHNYTNNSFYTAYTAKPEKSAAESHSNGNAKREIKSETNKDTVSISIAGRQFYAEQKASDSNMGSAKITSNLDSFRSAVKSMNETLPVNWEATADPFGTFRAAAKVESRLKQLQDQTVPKQDEDMERVANEYAKNKLASLIEKKKTMLASGAATSYSEEYAEYKAAYDAYHSKNSDNLIAMMTGDTKKAYNIYKNIIDGTSTSIQDEEFLMLHNRSMYIGAKSEFIRKAEGI